METKSPHMIIHPSPGMGHIIPMAEFAKRLVDHHNYTITFAIPTDGSSTDSMKSFLDALPKSIDYVFLSPVSFENVPKDICVETHLSLLMRGSLASLRDVFKSVTPTTKRVVAYVVDMWGGESFEVAREFDVPPYMFFPSTAMVLSFCLAIPRLDELHTCEFKDLPEPIKLPGCPPFPGSDVFDPAKDKTNDAYKWIVHHSKLMMTADGILLNTFDALEGGALKALKELGKPTIHQVGPLTQTSSISSADDQSGCLKWLDSQPCRSVVFVSFGSVGVLSVEQITELALGLEMSGERFLMVVKPPRGMESTNPTDFLPEGFLDRTKGRGLVVTKWAPQIEILSHGSTSGFVSHCGWNSTLESLMNNVPLISWPIYAEQKMNAVLLAEHLKVSLRPKENEKGIIAREEVARVVTCLLREEEGKKIKNKVKEIKDAGTVLMTEDGSSTKALSEMAIMWNKHHNI